MSNNPINFEKDVIHDFNMGPLRTIKEEETLKAFPIDEKDWDSVKNVNIPSAFTAIKQPPLEDWLKEFNVGSNVVFDTDTEHAIKELKIKNLQKYCRLNHTTKTL